MLYIGVRAGARTGYVIPVRDGNGGLDPARNSSAVVVVVVAAVRGEGEGGRREGFEILVTLAPYYALREEQWKGREEQFIYFIYYFIYFL